jgi:hypothetical protein
LALAHDRSLAHEIYQVCQAAANSVVQGCFNVDFDSFDELAAMLDSPRWGGAGSNKAVTGLHLISRYADENHWSSSEPPPTTGLMVWLKVITWKFSDADLGLLLSLASKCPRLQLLTIRGISAAAAVSKSINALTAAAERWPQLKHFDLEGNRLGLQPARSLAAAAAPLWPQLQHLNLAGSGSPQLGYKGIQALVTAGRHWKQLRHLDLSHNNLTTLAAQALAAGARHWPALQHLSLAVSDLGDLGVRDVVVSAGKHWPLLQHLNLAKTSLGDLGVEVVVSAAKQWPLLENLNLSSNGIGADGAQALTSAGKQWAQLQQLDLRGNCLDAAGQAALQELASVPSLKGRICFDVVDAAAASDDDDGIGDDH